jgi:hypothetical protein
LPPGLAIEGRHALASAEAETTTLQNFRMKRRAEPELPRDRHPLRPGPETVGGVVCLPGCTESGSQPLILCGCRHQPAAASRVTVSGKRQGSAAVTLR